jgi:hypothetical protein
MKEKSDASRVLVEKREGTRPLGRPTGRQRDVRTDVKDIGQKGLNCIHLGQEEDKWRILVRDLTCFSRSESCSVIVVPKYLNSVTLS